MTIPPRYFIAPTEPPTLRSLGRTTLLPETLGVDVLVYHYQPTAVIGFQRKEVHDFLSSLSDGRLAKELGQIADATTSFHPVLLLEGRFTYSNEGRVVDGYRGEGISKHSIRHLLLNIQERGVLVAHTDDIHDTHDAIQSISTYLAKPQHSSLDRRPKLSTKNSWGKVVTNNQASHILQGFPGIGPQTAADIYSTFGKVPLSWDVSEDDLTGVPGIGKKTARRLMEVLK